MGKTTTVGVGKTPKCYGQGVYTPTSCGARPCREMRVSRSRGSGGRGGSEGSGGRGGRGGSGVPSGAEVMDSGKKA